MPRPGAGLLLSRSAFPRTSSGPALGQQSPNLARVGLSRSHLKSADVHIRPFPLARTFSPLQPLRSDTPCRRTGSPVALGSCPLPAWASGPQSQRLKSAHHSGVKGLEHTGLCQRARALTLALPQSCSPRGCRRGLQPDPNTTFAGCSPFWFPAAASPAGLVDSSRIRSHLLRLTSQRSHGSRAPLVR